MPTTANHDATTEINPVGVLANLRVEGDARYLVAGCRARKLLSMTGRVHDIFYLGTDPVEQIQSLETANNE